MSSLLARLFGHLRTKSQDEIVAFFPGPFPPAKEHDRAAELTKDTEEWVIKNWPFKNEKEIAKFRFSKLNSFMTLCIPNGGENMLATCQVGVLSFLIDDKLDVNGEFEIIPTVVGLAHGTLKPKEGDRLQETWYKAWRAVECDAHPNSWKQFKDIIEEFYMSHVTETFQSVEAYLDNRHITAGGPYSFAFSRHALGIDLTDGELNHPLLKACEDITNDHISIANDLFSYAIESLDGFEATLKNNIIDLLKKYKGMDYATAQKWCIERVQKNERNYLVAAGKVLRDPVLSKSVAVKRWLKEMPYIMSGHVWWCQFTGRYYIQNVADVPSIPVHTPGGDFVPKANFALQFAAAA